MMYMTELSRSN